MGPQSDTSWRIDAHHHVWDLAVRDLPWTRDIPVLNRSFGMADLRPHLRKAGIGATVVVQTSAVAEETTDLLALAARDEHVRAVVGWTDVTHPAIGEALDRLREGPGARLWRASGTRFRTSRISSGCTATRYAGA